VRPLLIELFTATGFAVLYWWEVHQAGLMPDRVPHVGLWTLHAQYTSHVILISLMIVATFIDFDEKTIPDAITVPGTLAGLVLMAAWPQAAPPIAVLAVPVGFELGRLQLTSPAEWPQWLNELNGLWVGIFCFLAWCFAIWPKTVTMRRGLWKAVQYFFVSMVRWPLWWVIVLIAIAGSGGILVTWSCGAPWWPSLLTSLVGMAFGGGLIWAVRTVGGGALGKEAMGFGDVTLMAMIGAYLGWQASLMIFFLAPVVAVFICVLQWLLTGRRDIAFGPYLCAATLIMILWWSSIWDSERGARAFFDMGWLVPQMLFCCLLVMAGMLRLWRLMERAFVRGE
jgi:prepilin signal peptidase PulO-like enzyme (type II secretory pathway)